MFVRAIAFFPGAVSLVLMTSDVYAGSTADLGVIKTGPGVITQGSNITYTVLVTNIGPDPAQDVSLNDKLPVTTTFVSENQTSGQAFSCKNPVIGSLGTITCTLTSLPAAATASFTIVGNVNAVVPVRTILVNTATVSSSTPDSNSNNNSSSATTTVAATTPVRLQSFIVD